MTRALRVPKTIEQATALLESFSVLSAKIASIDARRNRAIAAANRIADKMTLPLLEQRQAITAATEPWWALNGPTLTKGKRKSIELGGCVIGSVSSRDTLGFVNGDNDAALAALRPHKWAKPFVRVTYSVDRVATFQALGGAHGKKLAALGFESVAGGETFFLKPVAQSGALSGDVLAK